MDLSQSNFLMKPPVSLEQNLLRCDTYVPIVSAATLNFVSHLSLNQNGLVGKCIRGQKIVVQNAHG